MYICMSGTGWLSHQVRFLPFLSVHTWGKPIPTLGTHIFGAFQQAAPIEEAFREEMNLKHLEAVDELNCQELIELHLHSHGPKLGEVFIPHKKYPNC